MKTWCLFHSSDIMACLAFAAPAGREIDAMTENSGFHGHDQPIA
jgi:hypothetical protein